MTHPRSQLVNLLIGKSILEIVLVGTIAVVAYVNAFPPTLQGWGEPVVDTRSIAGWAVNYASPWDRLEVQLFIDDKLHGTQVAQLSRPDVVAAGWAKDEWHGYNFPVSDLPPGDHEARVYALHKNGEQITLQLLGNPIRFAVNGDGTWTRR
ncbi:MAG TPA: hypothetical protein VGD38_06105 [Pyrinomonadaceae bacterium]